VKAGVSGLETKMRLKDMKQVMGLPRWGGRDQEVRVGGEGINEDVNCAQGQDEGWAKLRAGGTD